MLYLLNKATKVTDDLYTAVTNANMSLTDLAQAITYAGADMANAGYDLRQTAAAIGVLGDMGIQGSSAGTCISKYDSLFATFFSRPEKERV